MRDPVLERPGVYDDPLLTSSGAGALDSVELGTGRLLAGIRLEGRADYEALVERTLAVQRAWRRLPAPRRGEVVRRIGQAYREHTDDLGALITREMGKIRAEGIGEVVECVDIADFAVGLSRQLYGLSMHSERPQHRMLEQWHPLGVVGIITAFNFPMAVWAWNAMIAAVCGDTMIWKPSLATPLTALALNGLTRRVMAEQDVFRPEGGDPADVFGLVLGRDDEVGEALIADRRLPLISATGSCRMGRHVGQVVAARLGRSLLELGGNNALIVEPDADLELVVRAVLFGAIGTAGQRCTTTRRLLLHRDIADEVTRRLVKAYASVRIGDPMDEDVLMGPVLDERTIAALRTAIEGATAAGGEVLCGGLPGIERFAGTPGFYVEPTLVRLPEGPTPAVAREETFAPLLYVQVYDSLDEAIERQNEVDQGLSSALFTNGMKATERFLSVDGSDCGIANVNIGTSGAEIGGAFGGEKDTGGGREAGSDAWKAYMRRQTCTLNGGDELPLAQGLTFG